MTASHTTWHHAHPGCIKVLKEVYRKVRVCAELSCLSSTTHFQLPRMALTKHTQHTPEPCYSFSAQNSTPTNTLMRQYTALLDSDAWRPLWRPGYPSTLVCSATSAYVPNTCSMKMLRNMALFLPSVGSAVASFATALRRCVADLACIHQIQAGQVVQEMQRCILKALVIELQILLLEEQVRPRVLSQPVQCHVL